MNKLIIGAALCIFGANAMASNDQAKVSSSSSPNPQVLSIASFTVTDGVTVQLPKWRMADGTICQSYVASVGDSTVIANTGIPASSVTVTMGQICGKAKSITTGFFGHKTEDVPETLKAMKTVLAGKLAYQVPDLQVTN